MQLIERVGRQGPDPRRRGPRQLAEDRQADRDRRDEGDPRGDRDQGRVFQDAVDEPVAHRASRERRDRRRRRDEALDRPRRPVPQAPEALPEDRGARPRRNHVASANDFSAITELMDIKRLYEEQEEKWRQRLDRERRGHRVPRARHRGAGSAGPGQGPAGRRGRERDPEVRADAERQRQEMAAKVAQLNERIRDLNQKLLGTGGPGGPPRRSEHRRRLLQALTRSSSASALRGARAPAGAFGRRSRSSRRRRAAPPRSQRGAYQAVPPEHGHLDARYPACVPSRASRKSSRRPDAVDRDDLVPGFTPAARAAPPVEDLGDDEPARSRPSSSSRSRRGSRGIGVRHALLGLRHDSQLEARRGQEPREVGRLRCRARTGRRSGAPPRASRAPARPRPRRRPPGSPSLRAPAAPEEPLRTSSSAAPARGRAAERQVEREAEERAAPVVALRHVHASSRRAGRNGSTCRRRPSRRSGRARPGVSRCAVQRRHPLLEGLRRRQEAGARRGETS